MASAKAVKISSTSRAPSRLSLATLAASPVAR
jgi:hypothetical protein